MLGLKLHIFIILLICEQISPLWILPRVLLNNPRYYQNGSDYPSDVKLSFIELAKKFHHPAEEYQLTTEDGYIITLHHIPGNGPPVYLQHGILDSSDTFIIRGKSSLAIFLAEAGYDVWVGNARGNKYSRRHVCLDPDVDKQFWYFTIHEIGYYDLPTMIDFVLKKTGHIQLSAIGHSQGNAEFYILGSTRPKYNEKIKVMIALAPIAFLNHMKQPLPALVELAPLINKVCTTLGMEELMSFNSSLNQFGKSLCREMPLTHDLCGQGGLFLVSGTDANEVDDEFMNVALKHFPAGVSKMNLLHFAQISKAQRFQQYDHGPTKNLELYGFSCPPEYDLNKVTMKVELIVGQNDKVSTVEDVSLLQRKLPNAKLTVIKYRTMNHMDFVWGKNMDLYLFPLVLRNLKDCS
ncbi:hypothetical protein O0L34_g4613 [Tuta absoluta]|nr:hypothetical protein O0L34_g4613 [Tuta absoluta]